MPRHKLLDETDVPSGWGADVPMTAQSEDPQPTPEPEPDLPLEDIPAAIPVEPDPAVAAAQTTLLRERESFWQAHAAKQQEEARLRSKELTLEEGALNLLNQLNVHIRDEVLRIAHNRQCAAWMVIAGILLRLGDQGLLSETELDTSWLRPDYNGSGGHAWSPPQPTICAGGAHHFLPSRKGQKYCCTPCAQRHRGDKHQTLAHSDDCSVNRVGQQGTLVKETSITA